LYRSFGSSFGNSSRRVIVQTVVTPIVVAPPDDDLSGVDLDVVRPRRRVASAPERIPPPREPRSPEVVKPPPDDQQPERLPKPASPPPPPPKPEEDRRDPNDPWRLMDLGKAAFTNQEYGNAARRFGQVTEVAPNLPLGYFLRAQAEFALGKFRLAVRSVEAGLRLKPEWPGVKTFHPRLTLYKGHEAEFDVHLRRLADATQERPLDGDLLFLYGYQLWFDGRPAEAVVYFERARAVGANLPLLDSFFKEGGWKVAAK
jgi:tetratricopeptide (TPR) repeat protein